MKKIRAVIMASALGAVICVSAQNAFLPYSTQGDNMIHVTTADFDAVGAKDYVERL